MKCTRHLQVQQAGVDRHGQGLPRYKRFSQAGGEASGNQKVSEANRVPYISSNARIHARVLSRLSQVSPDQKANLRQANHRIQAKEGGCVSQRGQGSS